MARTGLAICSGSRPAIEKNDVNGRAAERARDSQAAEARADNDDYPVSFRHNAASGSK